MPGFCGSLLMSLFEGIYTLSNCFFMGFPLVMEDETRAVDNHPQMDHLHDQAARYLELNPEAACSSAICSVS